MNLCDRRQVVGVSCGEYRRAGAFAEFVVVPQRIVYELPAALSFEEAAMLEAVAVALHAVHLSEPRSSRSALVIGAGMIGLLTAQAARALGIERILIADVDDSRLRMARELGFAETLCATGDALVGRVVELTGGVGVDLALEAVGREETVLAAIDCVRKGGRVTLIGNIQPEVRLPLQKVVTRQIRLQGSAASAGEYPEAMAMVASGEIQVQAAHQRGRSIGGWAAVVRASACAGGWADQGDPSRPMRRRRCSESALRPDRAGGAGDGTSRGLGQSFARALARSGADLILTSRRRETLSDFAGEIEAMGRKTVSLELDVREEASIRQMAAAAEAAFGRIDILVNNAGCNVRKPALEVTWDDWNLILETNLRGTFFVAQAVARGMIERGYGRIINIGSVTSVFGYAGLAPYGASRGGVRQLTMSLADDWGAHGVTVNCLAPGMVQDRAEPGSLRERGVGELPYRAHPGETARPHRRSRWRGGLSRLGVEPLRHRPDAARGWRHLRGSDAGDVVILNGSAPCPLPRFCVKSSKH